jgi:hypothetical protein
LERVLEKLREFEIDFQPGKADISQLDIDLLPQSKGSAGVLPDELVFLGQKLIVVVSES